MAVPKVVGIETEYGILHAGGDGNPVASSTILVNAYAADLSRVDWDFEDEAPGNDARGFARQGAMPPEVETHLANTVLTNGARFYVDHAHPEFSSPECIDALEAVRWDKAGEEILRRAMRAATRYLPAGQKIVVYKNNSDGKGNSYGTHENYLMDRSVPFSDVARRVTPHFVTRQLICGAGKVGTETGSGSTSGSGSDVVFQISQRAEFFEEEVGLETTLKRPIVNTRDEPHADASRYRRLHVIVGDANLAEVSTFLKLGSTAFILCLIEDECFADMDLTLANPVRAIRQVAADPTLRQVVSMADGREMTALDIQWELLALAKKYGEDRGYDNVGGQAVGTEIIRRWEEVLHGLETDISSVSRWVDWAAKLELIEAYRERHHLEWSDHKLAALDIQYHDLREERSLFQRLDTEHLVTADEIADAVTEPPRTTRAFFRGRCLARWSDAVASANWDSIVFDLGQDPLRRVPMMDPLRGTASHVEALLEACETPADLLARLSG